MGAEGSPTQKSIEYCVKKKIPYTGGHPGGVSLPKKWGWTHRPDLVIGDLQKDDPYEKLFLIEIKPNLIDAVEDLYKEEYKSSKYLGIVGHDLSGKLVGQCASWKNPNVPGLWLSPTVLPYTDFYDRAYATYLKATNPLKDDIVDFANSLFIARNISREEIFEVYSGSFCSASRPATLTCGQIALWDECDKLQQNPLDEIYVMHATMFDSKSTMFPKKHRDKLGQYITEKAKEDYPAKMAKLTLDEFDKYKDHIHFVADLCSGTGTLLQAILSEVVVRYGKDFALKFTKEQLIAGDKDKAMREYTSVVMWNHTEKLFGKGVHIKIKETDLMKDKDDLSKTLICSNYPFNAADDSNYFSNILHHQLTECNLQHAIIMGYRAVFEKTSSQSRKIIGNDFYNMIEMKDNNVEFIDVKAPIAIVVFDKTKKIVATNNKIDVNKFTTVGQFNVKVVTASPLVPRKLKNGESIIKTTYNFADSIPFLMQEDLITPQGRRVPKPNAPVGTLPYQEYNKWIIDNPKSKYPKIKYYNNVLLYGDRTTGQNIVRLKYFPACTNLGNHSVRIVQGNSQILILIGLILTSSTFRMSLYTHFKGFHIKQKAINEDLLKTLPIPIETVDNKNQFKRLYEIGDELIIKGKTDPVLRDEADKIIEALYFTKTKIITSDVM